MYVRMYVYVLCVCVRTYLCVIPQHSYNITFITFPLQVFLNDKYGDYGCPLRVDHSDLRLVIEKASPDQQDILNKWYELDENNIPAMYRLLPVTRHIPEYGSSVRSTHLKAYKGWAETMDSITTALWDNSDQQFQRKYLVSSECTYLF